MKKSYFLALMIFMILSVTGIIIIQWYFIYTSIDNREEEFSMAVKQSMSAVANEIQENELRHYIETFDRVKDSLGTPDSSQLSSLFMFYDSDDESNLSSLFTFGLVEEEYSIPFSGESGNEITKVKDIKGISTTRIFKETFDRENNRRSFSTNTYKRIERINAFDQATYASVFSKMANSFPIHKRLDTSEVEYLLARQLKTRKINTPFEFGVFSDGLATRITSNNYKEMLSGYAEAPKKNKSQQEAVLFIKQKLDAAKWFIDAIEQRYQTLFLTINAIVDYQSDYFLTGDEQKLKPMILKDIADKIEMDISTVSRVANSKYIDTPYGVKLLKNLFSEGMKNKEGEDVSTIEIKNILEDLISNENKKKPLADQALAILLKEKGYKVARRTVAKYREQMDIPVARLRKSI